MERWTSEPTEESRTDSPQFTSRDLILIKCKETIEALTLDLENERKLRVEAETDLDTLHQDLAMLEDQLDELKDREFNATEQVRELQVEKEDEEKRTQRLFQENERLKKEKSEMDSKIQTQQRTIQSLTEALDRVNRELDAKQQAVSEWRRTLPALEQRLETLSRENQQLHEERDHYLDLYERETDQKKALQRMIEDAKSEHEALQRKMKTQAEEYQQQLTALERQKVTQHQELADNYNRKAAAYHEQSQLGLQEQKTLISRAAEEIERLESENSDLTQQLTDSLNLCERQKREISDLNNSKLSLEKEINRILGDLEDLRKSQKLENELKEKMQSATLLRLDEETQKANKLELTVDDLTEELTRRETYFQSQLLENRRQHEKSQEEHQKIVNELQNTKETLKKVQQTAADFVQESKNSHKLEVEKLQVELQRKEQNVTALETRLRDMENQRESDHDYFQIELLRMKDQRSQMLLAKEEEIRRLQNDRDRLRKQVEGNPPPPPLPASLPVTPSVPSLRFGSKSNLQRSARNSSSQSLRQSMESPLSTFSRSSHDITAYVSPRGAKSRAQSDGLRLLTQLKDLTARMESKPPAPKFS